MKPLGVAKPQLKSWVLYAYLALWRSWHSRLYGKDFVRQPESRVERWAWSLATPNYWHAHLLYMRTGMNFEPAVSKVRDRSTNCGNALLSCKCASVYFEHSLGQPSWGLLQLNECRMTWAEIWSSLTLTQANIFNIIRIKIF